MRTFIVSLVVAGILVAACSSPAPTAPGFGQTPDASNVAACGTASAAKCALGEACSSASMCLTANCVSNHCGAASCTDSKRDGDETGVDCGGSCAEKCDGEICTVPSGCKSHLCASGKCAPSGSKTCGVGTVALCSNGAECGVSADCNSDVCTQNGLCEAPGAGVHSDGTRNAGETGVDCGGSVASTSLCAAGQGCKASTDCEGVCPASGAGGGVCAAPNATDGKKNQGETDIDCGGPNAASCVVGKVCAASSDCTLKYCAAGNVCAVPTSTDGIKNGGETDADCGGATVVEGAQSYTAPRCASDKACIVDVDCMGSVCGENRHCAEAPSCRPVHGGQTCGTGEYGVAGSVHESCCKSLPVPGVNMVQGGATKQVYLDKYEITAGRIRAWLDDIRAHNAGVPNVQAWVAARVATDPLLAPYFPKLDPSNAASLTYVDYLPAQNYGQLARNGDGTTRLFKVDPSLFTAVTSEFYHALDAGGSLYPPTAQCPDKDNCYITRDMGLFHQVGPTSYLRGATSGGTSGCAMYTGGYGHRTYAERDGAFQPYFGEPARNASIAESTDEKSANCLIPAMFAAFCAWDGGYVMSRQALAAAYGPQDWPWGSSPDPWSLSLANEHTMPGNFNWGVNSYPFTSTRRPAYNFPLLGDASWTTDYTPVIASPGRFPGDIASVTRPGVESWMDLGSNFIEWSFETDSSNREGYWGWTGSSWEGHVYPGLAHGAFPGAWKYSVYILDKYGKGGTRCMRLR